jgi:hypothetical protein
VKLKGKTHENISLKPVQYLELSVTQNYILYVDGMKGFLSAVIIMLFFIHVVTRNQRLKTWIHTFHAPGFFLHLACPDTTALNPE